MRLALLGVLLLVAAVTSRAETVRTEFSWRVLGSSERAVGTELVCTDYGYVISREHRAVSLPCPFPVTFVPYPTTSFSFLRQRRAGGSVLHVKARVQYRGDSGELLWSDYNPILYDSYWPIPNAPAIAVVTP